MIGTALAKLKTKTGMFYGTVCGAVSRTDPFSIIAFNSVKKISLNGRVLIPWSRFNRCRGVNLFIRTLSALMLRLNLKICEINTYLLTHTVGCSRCHFAFHFICSVFWPSAISAPWLDVINTFAALSASHVVCHEVHLPHAVHFA